jgi:hypothetical protein
MGEELISIGNEGDRETLLGLRKVVTGPSIGGESAGLGDARVVKAASGTVDSIAFEAAGSLDTAATGPAAVEAGAATPDVGSDVVGGLLVSGPVDWICCSFGGAAADVASLTPVSFLGRVGKAGG